MAHADNVYARKRGNRPGSGSGSRDRATWLGSEVYLSGVRSGAPSARSHAGGLVPFRDPNPQRSSIGGAAILFKTDHARITRIDVWDGDQPLLRHDAKLSGDYSARHVQGENVLLTPDGEPKNIYRGVGVSILAEPTRQLAGSIDFISVGIAFHDRQ
jgi:hypothetical protein